MPATGTKKGKQHVLVPREEYELLVTNQVSDKEALLPSLPDLDRDGTYPAVEFARMSLARDIILARR